MEYSLYLYPEGLGNGNRLAQSVVEGLQEIAVIAQADDPSTWMPGDKLMDYITFLGCSPAFQQGEIESVIRLHHRKKTFALGGTSVDTLRFPDCRHKIENALEIVENYPAPWQCPHCDNHGGFEQINWRRSAAASSLFIEISGIFPKEAVPADKLLTFLRQQTDSDWNWFYALSQ